MTFALQIQNLTRHFNDLVAVDNISFDIRQGEIFGLLGPNGAGKTTTLSMLATMLTPRPVQQRSMASISNRTRTGCGNPSASSSRTRALTRN